ncbi:hypothetical protein P4218_29500 [Bacillus thuringiensis]|nr:hypothetical protein [Bacillus thuringiensis]
MMGILFSIYAMFIDNLSKTLKVEGINVIIGLNWLPITLSVIGIIGCLIVTFKAKIGGILMIISAIGGFICISFFNLLPGTLLLISGLMSLFRKEKPNLTVI